MSAELLYKHKFAHHPRSERGVLLLHGANGGIESGFMQALWARISPVETCLAVEFPFIAAESKPSKALTTEINVVQAGLKFMEKQGALHTHIVAKSLGGVVASKWLKRGTSGDTSADLTILGYVLGDVATDNLAGHLRLVVQGSEDRFGTAADVKADLAMAHIDAHVVNIPGGDHSFRAEDGSDHLQQQAIDVVAARLLLNQPR